MSMINRQIEWLNELSMADMSFYKDEDYRKACKEAANTIEQLAAKVRKENNDGWIPITYRPMTEEEKKYYAERTIFEIEDLEKMLDCPLPEDGQEVLVSSGGYVCVDTFCTDDGCYFEGVDIDDVDAWMPLPEPYKAESEE